VKRASIATAATLSLALLLGAPGAEAHLMAAGNGTVNVVGANVYAVLSVPVSALPSADDDHDGVLDARELDRHEAALRDEVDRRLAILDGAVTARTVRVDLILSPAHDGPGDRADHVVVLKHAVLDAPPAELRVRCDLFGEGATDRTLTFTATRHPASGVETDVAALTPDAVEHAFFPTAPPRTVPGTEAASVGALGRGPFRALGALVLAGAALVAAWRARRASISASRAVAGPRALLH
jgi:hypothetical protein